MLNDSEQEKYLNEIDLDIAFENLIARI